MTKVFEKQEFGSFADRDSGSLFSDIEFRGCYFQGCNLSVTEDPNLRSTVRNVQLLDCSQRGCAIYPAIFEDVLVDGFNTNGQLVQAWGAAFNRVVLRGKIDRLMISSVVDVYGDRPNLQRAFDEANAEYYRSVEWALDISQAEFKELDIRGVFPVHLIRRDPETQVVVTRERALKHEWKSLDFQENLLPFSIDFFLKEEEPATLLIAPKRHPKFRRYLQDIKTLRAAGVAEPD